LGRVVATRATLLADLVHGFDLGDLPDPLPRLPALLEERVSGTQSTIHGDLNLENILVGPGGFVWLIDFAQTRDGHTLFDFAYLEAALIAQVLPTPSAPTPAGYAQFVNARDPLLAAVRSFAARCLFNLAQPREYHLALALACLGSLKFTNLDPGQRQRLYLTAAALSAAFDL
jgi:Ser/Thr protein kinase RdoA (MazF antagonist)